MTNDTAVLDKVLSASSLTELADSTGKKPKRVYLMFARLVHPDMFQSDADKLKAKEAFAHLSYLKNHAEGYKPSGSKNTIKTKKHEYEIGTLLNKGDVFSTYSATYDAGHESCIFSIVNSPQDADLAEAHASSIKKLSKIDEKYTKFYPDMVEFFKYRDETTHIDRPVTTVKIPEGFQPLSDVLKVYPGGIGGRDIAWIFRRMLVAIGNAHDIGLVNGAPTIDAYLIHAEKHGMILSEWQYSVEDGQKLKAVPSTHKDIYPSYALQKEAVGYKLDIHIAAQTALSLMRDDGPRQLVAFFKGSMVQSVPEASVLLADFDKLLLRLYGKPKFNKFTLQPDKEN